MSDTSAAKPVPKSAPWVRAFVDYGPLAIWAASFAYFRFVAHSPEPLVSASWFIIGGSIVALAVGWFIERRIAFVPLLAGGFAVIFGGLTLIFHDAWFVKVKPTVLYVFLSAMLLGGLATGRLFLKMIIGEQLHMSDASWRTLTLAYVGFFLGVAALNIVVWLGFSEEIWVLFRFIGVGGLAILFTLAMLPFMLKHGRFGAQEAQAPDLPPS